MMFVATWLAAVIAVTPAEPSVDRVTVATAPANADLLQRVRAELEAIGYQVDVVLEELDDPALQLLPLGRERGSSAIVWLDSSEAGVVIWVEDRATGKTVRRAIAVAPDGEASKRVIAHRVVELLRTSLLELEQAPPPPEAEVPVPEPAQRLLRRQPERFALRVGAGVVGSRGAIAPAASLGLEFRFMPIWRIGAALEGQFPVHPSRISAPEGEAELWTSWIVAWTHLELRVPGRVVRPYLGLGLGAFLFGLRGRAEAPFSARSEVVASGTLNARAGLAVALSSRVRLFGSATMGATLPRPIVRIAGREVAEFGSPWGHGQLGVEVVLR